MTLELARRLLATGAIAARDVEAALYLSVVRGVSVARALVDRGVLGERALEEELSRRAGLPLRQVHPAPDIVDRLPQGMCRMLAAVPLRFDQVSGVTEIAAVDPLDGHVASEFTFHLGTPIRVQRATMASIEEAIRRFELAEGGGSSRSRRRTPAFPHGAPDTVPPSPPPSKPSSEELPIPLVRRLSAPAAPSFPDEPTAQSAMDAPELPPEAPVPAAVPDEDDQDQEVTREMPRRRVLRSSPDVPSISFPSAPPPISGSDMHETLATADAQIEAYEAWAREAAERQAEAVAREDAPGTDAVVQAEQSAEAAPVGEEEPTPLDADAPLADGPEPETIPRTPEAGWSPTLPELLDLISRARSRDDLLELVLRAVTLIAQRAAVFVVRREGFMGWSCNPAFGSEEALRKVVISAAQPSIFATSAATGFYLGPIPRTPVHAGLLGVLRRASSDVAVYVAKARGRPTIVIVADNLDDTLLGTRALGEIAKRAGDALARILSQR